MGKSAFSMGPIAWLACGYVLLLLIGGGGGSPAPLAELFCKGLAAVACCLWLWLDGPAAIRGAPALPWVAGLILLVPLIQLVPLPPSLWHELPGRDLLRDNLALVGADRAWRPLSIATQRTLDGVLALFPPLLAMLTALDRVLPRHGLQLTAQWPYPEGGSITSRLSTRLLAKVARLFVPDPHPGDILCLAIRKGPVV